MSAAEAPFLIEEPLEQRRLPDYLPARMLNEFVYCPRPFFYECVEGLFAESADGRRLRSKPAGRLWARVGWPYLVLQYEHGNQAPA